MKEYHVEAKVFVVMQVEDGAGEEEATAAFERWLSDTCPFEEMEVDSVEVSHCAADEELRRMHNGPNN